MTGPRRTVLVGALLLVHRRPRGVLRRRPRRSHRGEDWSPAPASVDGLTVLAEADADGVPAAHRRRATRRSSPAINLGSSVPTRQPGEVGSITAEHYRRWFAEMADLGIRVVRIYTLHPPAFYDELAAYNRAHPDAPLYLVQGVYLPDESYIEPGRTPLRRRRWTRRSPPSSRDVSAAVHGDLTRAAAGRAVRPAPGAPTSRRGCVSWIVGVEWDPAGHRPDGRAGPPRAVPARAGYFAATDDATQHRALDRPPPGRAGRGRGDARRLACRSRSPTGRPPTRSSTPRSRWRRGGPRRRRRRARAAHRRLAGRDVRQLPRLPLLPRLPAPRARAAGRDRRPGGPVRRATCAALQDALRLDAAADHRVRGAVLAGLGARRHRSAATRARTPSRRRWGSTPT